jgi:hypothetical protein
LKSHKPHKILYHQKLPQKLRAWQKSTSPSTAVTMSHLELIGAVLLGEFEVPQDLTAQSGNAILPAWQPMWVSAEMS